MRNERKSFDLQSPAEFLTDLWRRVRRGTYRMVGTDGRDEWVPDEANGRHLRLTEKVSKLEVGKIIDELICRPPKASRR